MHDDKLVERLQAEAIEVGLCFSVSVACTMDQAAERIQALSNTPAHGETVALRESALSLTNLAVEFQRWLDMGPDPQPHWPNGICPFSTGDLKALVADLKSAAAALTQAPAPVDMGVLQEALEDFCQAAEYWAGCDEGCTPDAASSEIMSSGGAWPAQAYDKARHILAALSPATPTDQDGGK
jgi:hypothetical protein